GWDSQNPWADGRLLREKIDLFAGDRADDLSAALSSCLGADAEDASDFYRNHYDVNEPSNSMTEESHQACIEALDEVDAWLEASVDSLAPRDHQWARLYSVSLRSWENKEYYFFQTEDVRQAYEARDIANFEIIQLMDGLLFDQQRV